MVFQDLSVGFHVSGRECAGTGVPIGCEFWIGNHPDMLF